MNQNLNPIMKPFLIPITRLPHAEDLPLPTYGTQGSAGADLYAAIEAPLILKPGEQTLISTGIKIALPIGYEAQIRPRSGLALKHGLTVLNAPATIDSDYRGEIKVILINLSQTPFTIERGTRIAQMIIAPYSHVSWQEVSQIEENTDRQTKGFGSTGY